jgi:hypothetical protein
MYSNIPDTYKYKSNATLQDSKEDKMEVLALYIHGDYFKGR